MVVSIFNHLYHYCLKRRDLNDEDALGLFILLVENGQTINELVETLSWLVSY